MAKNDNYDLGENDIAIVGMGAHLPGARTPTEYWNNLVNGVESIRFYTEEELLAAGEALETIRRPDYVPAGAPLQDLELFDGDFFGFSPKECGILDPQHRHFLEVCWEAFEDAGHTPEKFEGTIALFGGVGMGSYFAFNLLTNPELVNSEGLFFLRHTGNDKDFLSTRVSYILDLKGPSVNVQTACSTSLVATHMGVQSLLAGECDMAIAGGVTIELPHHRGYLFKEGEVLSPDGHCHAFDHRGQGTVFGSGAGAVVLRRAEDAIADNDHIYAIIKATAINNDGASKVGYFAPSVDGQASAMIEAYDLADITADTIGYVECHGTGTYMGDPIEVSGLTQAFRQTTDQKQFCRIGSVKTNIGHLDTAAGVAGLIKATLSLQNKQIPPSLSFEKPNPNIDFENSPFIVNDKLYDWVETANPRRAAINSLGVGGTNAHIVLQEPPVRPATQPSKHEYQLITLTGRSRKAVEQNGLKLADYLEQNPDVNFADIAWTLRVGRKDFDQRAVFAAKDHAEAVQLLRQNDLQRIFTHTKVSDKPECVFLLPGGGAQYATMGADLYKTEPVYRQHIDRGLEQLRRTRNLDLAPLMYPSAENKKEAHKQLADISCQLPAIFLTSYAMAQLLMSWDITPSAVIGHSLGENTAACLAGVFSFEDALELTALRGELLKRTSGSVTSVQLTPDKLQPYIDEFGLDLATVNTPELCAVSGPVADIEKFEQRLSEQNIEFRRINVPIPPHSKLLDPILGDFRSYLQSIRLNQPKVPLVSNRTGTWITNEEATNPEYWVRHLRETVWFAEGVKTLLQKDNQIFLEVGPGRILSSLTRQHPTAPAGLATIPTTRHPEQVIPDDAYFKTTLGRVWATGYPVNIEKLWEGEKRQRIPLPTYAFQRSKYWIEPGKGVVDSEDLSNLVKSDAVEEYFYKYNWVGAPLAADIDEGTFNEEKNTWLFFKDPMGISDRIIERLKQRGDTVVSVETGDAYVQINEHAFVLAPERGREGYDSLIKDLMGSGLAPNRIAHMWLATDKARVRMGSSPFHTHTQYGFYSLLFLLQSIADHDLPGPIHISTFTTGATRVQDEKLPFFEKSMVSGPIRVAARELTGVTASWIDIEIPPQPTLLEVLPIPSLKGIASRPEYAKPEGLGMLVLNELVNNAESGTFAYRSGQRYQQVYRPTKLKTLTTQRLRHKGCYFITGGLGGLGLTFAEHLAKKYQARLILTARTPLPARDKWDEHLTQYGPQDKTSSKILKIRALEQAGAEVLTAELDVTDIETLREVLSIAEERFTRIDGVFHAAGLVRDELIQMKTQQSVEDVFGPKVHGTMVLQAAFEDRKPDFIVLFSSTSSVLAPVGQVDYVAANVFLNTFAEHAVHDLGQDVIAVNWGIWNEVGLAAEAMRQNLSGEEAPQTRTPVEHPLLDVKLDQDKGDTVISTLFNPEKFWILDQHRTKSGDALIPGTGYLELARAALEAFGHNRAFEIRNLFFFRPLHVPDGETKEVRLHLERAREGYHFEIRSHRQTSKGSGWELHAQAELLLQPIPQKDPIQIGEIKTRCARLVSTPEGVASSQAVHLQFGQRWMNLREARYGANEALALLSLPNEFAGEADIYKLHPALVDIATGYAMELIDGYKGDNLWVPVSYFKVKYLAPLPSKIYAWVRNHGKNSMQSDVATFDCTLTDEHGNICMEVESFSIKRLEGTVEFAAAAEPSASELQLDKQNNKTLSPAEQLLLKNMQQGILPVDGIAAVEAILSTKGVTPTPIVSSMDLSKLVRQQDLLANQGSESSGTKFDRPELDSDYVEPRNDIERTIVSFWEELLGVNQIGVRDSFFELGGHSLIAVRLFAKLKQAYNVDYPISVLFTAPTVEQCADMIKEAIGDTGDSSSSDTTQNGEVKSRKDDKPGPRYVHLVPMHKGEGGPKRPFFLVAGMFGNVLNLGHLANLIGTDRPFYGLQARGLYGDQKPHETFEEAAHDCIEEMRMIQPHGPYLVGGFSGGGLTAWEIAQQLNKAGEEVAMLLLLDSRLPQVPDLRVQDRLRMKLLDFQRSGPAYLVEWGKNRVEWEVGKVKKLILPEPEIVQATPTSFQNDAIEAAHYRALERYKMQNYSGRVTLFRPKLSPSYVINAERWIDDQDKYLFHDNGFGKYSGDLEVFEMPGDHDSMVLEPNVRVMARRLRKLIERAELEVDCREQGVEPPPRDRRELELAHATRGPQDFTA